MFIQGPDKREERLNQLVTLYERDLLRMCFVYLHDAALAEDAVQETFLKAYKALPSFREEASEKTWLMRIAINTCKDLRRGGWFRYVNRNVSLDSLPAPLQDPTGEDNLLTMEIMRLPRKQMEVILLLLLPAHDGIRHWTIAGHYRHFGFPTAEKSPAAIAQRAGRRAKWLNKIICTRKCAMPWIPSSPAWWRSLAAPKASCALPTERSNP